MEPGKLLSAYGIKSNDSILFKDLGPQISWKLVFVLEYLGPILIHTLFFLRPDLIYGQVFLPSAAQVLSFIFVVCHFAKREYETLYIHRFSNATMPIMNLPKNCFHYWILGGVLMAYPIYHPNPSSFNYGLEDMSDKPYLGAVALLFAFFEMGNLVCHMMLRDLRPVGSKERKVI